MLAALALLAGLAWAQEQSQQAGPILSGQITAGFVDANLLGDPFVSDVPGFSGILSTDLELRLSSSAYRAAADRSVYKGVLTETRGLGYEFGAVIDMADMLDLGSVTSKASFDADTSGYPLVQPMLDWYSNNYARYGMPPMSWPTTSYGASSGRYQFIHGHTAEPIEWVAWDQAKWSDARALYVDLVDAIKNAIEAISPDVTSGSGEHINQYSFQALSAPAKEKVLAEQDAYDGFQAFVYGSNGALSVNGIKIVKAWLAFTNLFGVMDARLDYKGSALSAGSMVRSPRSAQPEAGSTLRLAMAPGLVSGLSASITAALAGGVSSEAEDWNTKSMEAYPGEPAWLGVKLSAAYDLAFLLGQDVTVGLDLLFPDLTKRLDAGAASASVRYVLNGELSIDASVEADALLWNDRNIKADSAVFAVAFGGGVRADYLGLGVSAKAAFKQAGFGGWGGNDLSDRFGGLDLWSDFDAAKVGSALALEGGLFAVPSAILGMDLGGLSVGYRALLYGAAGLALQGTGLYADLTIKLRDLLRLPVSVALEAASWTNPGLVSYEDASAWPVRGLLSDVSWKASVSVAPSERILVSLEATDRDSGYKRDTYRVMSLGLNARIAF